MNPQITLSSNSIHGYSHTVIFLHDEQGKGINYMERTKNSINSENKTLDSLFPTMCWVFPSAATQRDSPISQWYSYKPNDNLQIDKLVSSINHIQQLVRQEAHQIGGRWDRIILAGVGQGAAIATYVCLSLDHPKMALPDGNLPLALGGLIISPCDLPFIPGKSLNVSHDDRATLEDILHGNQVLLRTPISMLKPATSLSEDDGLNSLSAFLTETGVKMTCEEYPTTNWFESPEGVDAMTRTLTNNTAIPPGQEAQLFFSMKHLRYSSISR